MSLSESRFNMWRAVVAMIHADDVVQPHEINFIIENTRNLVLSEAQSAQLAEDVRTPYDIQKAFGQITSPRDKEDFFHFARAIAWSDGDFDEREQAFLRQIAGLSTGKDDVTIIESSARIFEMKSREERSLMSVLSNLLHPKAA